MKKVKLDFNKPHITYREKSGQTVVGATTAINKLAMPALPIWGFNTGRQSMYQTIPEAAKAEDINLKKLNKEDATSWAFSVGQQRKNSTLYAKRDRAAEVGTIAHAILQYRERGLEIDNSDINDNVWKLALKCVASHDQWFQGTQMKTVLIEKAFVSEEHHYGGTMDKLAEINGELTLIDYKTGKDIYDTNFIQLAAYTRLAIEQGFDVKHSIAVNMPKTKGNSFAIKSVPAESLFEAGYFKWFLSSVDAYYAEKQTKQFKDVI